MLELNEIIEKITKDVSIEREKWINEAINENNYEQILDFQEFIAKNNIVIKFNMASGFSELYMNDILIGKFNEVPEIIEHDGGFRFNLSYWIRNERM